MSEEKPIRIMIAKNTWHESTMNGVISDLRRGPDVVFLTFSS